MNRQWQDRVKLLEDRCACLELANGRLIGVTWLLLSAAVIGIALGFRGADKPAPIEATALTIVDDDGSMRAWIGNEEGFGRIKLYDQNEEVFWKTPQPQENENPDPIGLPPGIKIPEPLTEEQISKMTLEETQAALKRVADGRRHARLDKKTSERLRREFRMLIERIAGLRRNGTDAA